MSVLAPVSGGSSTMHALLLLTDDAGATNTAEVGAARPSAIIGFRAVDYLLLAADLEAIPMEKRVNPVPGK